MQTVIPALRMTDWDVSRAFYVEGLGFSGDWEHRFGPDFPVFVQISHGEQVLYLSEHAGDCEVGGLVYFYVSDVDAWRESMIERGLNVDVPRDQPWGNRELRLKDPDGNTLNIAMSLPE
jgi:catechol 2,3-dioxygenase-like lactoylglutathione lyase family enzyme